MHPLRRGKVSPQGHHQTQDLASGQSTRGLATRLLVSPHVAYFPGLHFQSGPHPSQVWCWLYSSPHPFPISPGPFFPPSPGGSHVVSWLVPGKASRVLPFLAGRALNPPTPHKQPSCCEAVPVCKALQDSSGPQQLVGGDGGASD